MSIYRSLPERPSLEQLKSQAKELLSAVRAAQPEAIRRFEGAHPRCGSVLGGGPKLSDAQLVLAREYDFASWPALHDYVRALSGVVLSDFRAALERGNVSGATQRLDARPLLVAARFPPDNDTPLHVAAGQNQKPLAELLIDRGARIGALNSWRGSPLACALIGGHTLLAELLLERGAPVATLAEAAGVGRIELMRRFWSEGGQLRPEASFRFGSELEPGVWESHPSRNADERELLQSAFEYACRNGRLEAAQYMLERGAELEGSGVLGAPPLHWAAARGQNESVRFLVAQGADLLQRDPKFNGTAFFWAREFHHTSTLALLRELGYQPDIWEAASTGDVARVQQLLAADPALLDQAHWGTPLCEACAWAREAVARLLIERGANPALATRDGQLPIDLARERGLLGVVELLSGRTPRGS